MPPSAFARSRFTRPLLLGFAMWCLTSLMAVAQSSVLVVDAFNKKVHVVQFAARGIERFPHEGHEAFRIALPDRLLRLQRREYYRLTAPSPHSLSCQIPIVVGGENKVISVEADVVDISGGGLAITVPPNGVVFEPDMEYADCRLMLPEVGPIATALRVRNLFRITNRDGSVMLRAGCEFMNLSASMASSIQCYNPACRTRTQRPGADPLMLPAY